MRILASSVQSLYALHHVADAVVAGLEDEDVGLGMISVEPVLSLAHCFLRNASESTKKERGLLNM